MIYRIRKGKCEDMDKGTIKSEKRDTKGLEDTERDKLIVKGMGKMRKGRLGKREERIRRKYWSENGERIMNEEKAREKGDRRRGKV